MHPKIPHANLARKVVHQPLHTRHLPMPHSDHDPLALLPHGEGFRFVDQLISLDPGKSATASYRVKNDELFFQGHFPGNPIVPGVILIEALAQLGGVVAQTDPQIEALHNMKLTAVKQAKILGAAQPGAELDCLPKLRAVKGSISADGLDIIGSSQE
jgi:3-hydroxyacyl-[acyl-carrier-protein] dehydratase